MPIPGRHAARAAARQLAACAQFTLAVGLTGQVSLSKVLFLEQGTLCTPSLATVTPCTFHDTFQMHVHLTCLHGMPDNHSIELL